ncbi:hypothetical protein pb186bvf_007619 [Paramecium bursaria]
MDDEFDNNDFRRWVLEYLPWKVDQHFQISLNILRNSMINEIPDELIEKFDVFFDLLAKSQYEKMIRAHEKLNKSICALSVRQINMHRSCIQARLKTNYPELQLKGNERNLNEIQEIFQNQVQDKQLPMIDEFTENAIDEFKKELKTRNQSLNEIKQQIKELDQDDIIKKYLV